MKKYAQRIKALEEKISSNKDAITALIDTTETESREMTDVEMEQVQLAKSTIDESKKSIDTLKAAEEALGTTIATATKGFANVVKNVGDKERKGGELIYKTATASLLAFNKHMHAGDVAEQIYGKDPQAVDFIKAASVPATTTGVGFAAELLQETFGEFLTELRATSYFAQLATAGVPLNFNGQQSILFPAEDGVGHLSGDWVAEGGLIPVKQGAYTSRRLNRYKMGVISHFSAEILQSSIPNVEGLVRDAIIKDTSTSLDVHMISNSAAVAGVSPAGLLAGVTPVASAGTTIANIVADVKALVTPLVNNGANGSDIVLLMNDQHLLGLSTALTAAGNFAFKAEVASGTLLGYTLIASRNVPAGTVVGIDSMAFASAYDAPEFEVNNSATLIQADNQAAKPDLGDYTDLGEAARDGTNTPGVVNLWQQNLVGLRTIFHVGAGLKRDNAVTSLSGVAW